MSRFAGDLLGQLITGDPAVLAMLGGGALAGVVPAVAGAADLAMGPTNLSNSGEIGINPLLAMLPGVGAGVGIAASGLNKDVRDLVKYFALMGKPLEEYSQEDVEFVNRGREEHESLVERATLLNEQRVKEGKKPYTPDEMQGKILRTGPMGRGIRGIGAGALIGSVAGAIPAVMLMRDSQPAQQPVAAQ